MPAFGQRAAPHRSPAQVPRRQRHPAHPALRHVAVRSTMIDTSLFAVSLFPSNKVLLPTATGTMHVFEQRFLQMFDDLAAKAGGNIVSASGVRFGHILSPSAAPPALLEDSIGGVPRVGVLASVKRVTRLEDGSLMLQYEGAKRIKLLSIWQSQPYMIAAASFLTDSVSPSDESLVDSLESDLYGQLQEVGRLSRRLRTSEDDPPTSLPDSIPRYAPPPRPSRPRTLADHLTDAGHPAGTSISMWQRYGSVYGNVKRGRDAMQDPYEVLSERLGKDIRQELFSFAAAGILELGPAEALALLISTDRAARLQWVAAAVEPFLEEQRARAALARVLGGSGGAGGGDGPAA